MNLEYQKEMNDTILELIQVSSTILQFALYRANPDESRKLLELMDELLKNLERISYMSAVDGMSWEDFAKQMGLDWPCSSSLDPT